MNNLLAVTCCIMTNIYIYQSNGSLSYIFYPFPHLETIFYNSNRNMCEKRL